MTLKNLDIETYLRRLSRIPIQHQIVHLKSVIDAHPYSDRANLLRPVLAKKMLKQLKKESPRHRESVTA